MTRAIRTREQLLRYIRDNLSSFYRSVHRALEKGTVKNLGGFHAVPQGSLLGGWIVEVTSIRKQKWYVCVKTTYDNKGYTVGVVKNVPWDEKVRFSMDPLYAGDSPVGQMPVEVRRATIHDQQSE
jgi:hypothetical protein